MVRDALVNYGSQYELEHIMPHWTSRGQEVDDFPKGMECTLVHVAVVILIDVIHFIFL